MTSSDFLKLSIKERKDIAQRYLLDYAKQSKENNELLILITKQYINAPSLEEFINFHLGRKTYAIAFCLALLGE